MDFLILSFNQYCLRISPDLFSFIASLCKTNHNLLRLGTIKPISDTQGASYDVRKKKKTTQSHRQGGKRKLDKRTKLEFMVGRKIKRNAKGRSYESEIQTSADI